jgi:hypothetical protein
VEPTALEALALAHGWTTRLSVHSSPHLGRPMPDGSYVPGQGSLRGFRDGLRVHIIVSEGRDGSWDVSYLTVCRRPPDVAAPGWSVLDDGPYGRPDHCFADTDPGVLAWSTAQLTAEIERAQIAREYRRRQRTGEHNPWRQWT